MGFENFKGANRVKGKARLDENRLFVLLNRLTQLSSRLLFQLSHTRQRELQVLKQAI